MSKRGLRCLLMSLALTASGMARVAAPADAQEPAGPSLRYQVRQVGRIVDLSRGKEEFLTISLDVSGLAPAAMRRVQPLREDFTLLAGKSALPCRWLRGGSLPNDPRRLRFTLGFSVPPPTVKTVSLKARLADTSTAPPLELRLEGLVTDQRSVTRSGVGWKVTIRSFRRGKYLPPSLPPKGAYQIKGIPVDHRIFRMSAPQGAPPTEAVSLQLASRDTNLYDNTLNLSGYLIVAGGKRAPMLSAHLQRVPSRVVEKPRATPRITGQFHFAVPPVGRPTGVVLRFTRRAAKASRRTIQIDNLPVPGR